MRLLSSRRRDHALVLGALPVPAGSLGVKRRDQAGVVGEGPRPLRLEAVTRIEPTQSVEPNGVGLR